MMRSRYLDSTTRSRTLSAKATRTAAPNSHPNERLRERRIRLFRGCPGLPGHRVPPPPEPGTMCVPAITQGQEFK
jgi:hypothetical protein